MGHGDRDKTPTSSSVVPATSSEVTVAGGFATGPTSSDLTYMGLHWVLASRVSVGRAFWPSLPTSFYKTVLATSSTNSLWKDL